MFSKITNGYINYKATMINQPLQVDVLFIAQTKMLLILHEM